MRFWRSLLMGIGATLLVAACLGPTPCEDTLSCPEVPDGGRSGIEAGAEDAGQWKDDRGTDAGGNSLSGLVDSGEAPPDDAQPDDFDDVVGIGVDRPSVGEGEVDSGVGDAGEGRLSDAGGSTESEESGEGGSLADAQVPLDGGEDTEVSIPMACDGEHNDCHELADCFAPGDGSLEPLCVCRQGYIGGGRECRRPSSCSELHDSVPSALSGSHVLAVLPTDGAASLEYDAQCEMEADGGGWTLVFNADDSFDPVEAADGEPAYSLLDISEEELMFDFSNAPIEADNYVVRVIISPTGDPTAGYTAQELLTLNLFINRSATDDEVDDIRVICLDDTGQVGTAVECQALVEMNWSGLAAGLYGSAQIRFQDILEEDCQVPGRKVALGLSTDGNCTGWPQNPGGDFPTHVRMWIR